jgi:hypothetical protein
LRSFSNIFVNLDISEDLAVAVVGVLVDQHTDGGRSEILPEDAGDASLTAVVLDVEMYLFNVGWKGNS